MSPSSPATICAYPGCNTLVISGRCARHRSIEERPSARERGYDAEWRKFSADYLRRYPICACRTHCHGALANQVDHVVPLAVAPHRKYDFSNLRPICKSCHAAKSARERTRSVV